MIQMRIIADILLVLLVGSVHCFSSASSHYETVDQRNRINPKFINKWLDEYLMVSGNRTPPKMFIEWIKLASAHNCSVHPSDYQGVFEDLKPFKMPGMSKEYMKVAASIIEAYGREALLITKDNLAELSEKLPYHIGNALDLVNSVLDPKIDFNFIIQYFDESMIIPSDDHSPEKYIGMDTVFERNSRFRETFSQYRAIPKMFPVMSVNRMIGFYDIIMPTRRNGLGVLTSEQRAAALESSNWDKKIPKAVFRGATTGINFSEAKKKGLDITANPRFKLYEMAFQQQEGTLNCSVDLDFAITKYRQFNSDDDHMKELQDYYPEGDPMSLLEQFKVKYVVLVDGNAWPEKIAAHLLSGSLVFIATIHEDWVIRELTDGEDYIKLKPDLSDLIEKLEWAQANDHLARAIAENGKQLALTKFDTKHLQVYNAFLMMEYQNLFAKKEE